MSDVSISHPDDPEKVVAQQRITGTYPDLTVTITVDLGPILRGMGETEGPVLVEREVRVVTPEGEEVATGTQ